jgi:thiamine pyrophosphate-dependent acetolactate synthase large subunit-like protein
MATHEGQQTDGPMWGSDAMADALVRSGVRFVALNPGSSYRGLHDSLVNGPGADRPELLVCLHEEHAVAIAHGWAKVTGTPMAVAVHSNVGLMHASMALYNAFCDRVPMIVLGANGPWAADRRRPYIDWIHTSADMGALVRPFVKWDDQPGSVEAAVASLVRANAVTRAYPSAPVYVCVDVTLQEEVLAQQAEPAMDRYRPATPPAPAPDGVAAAAALLVGAHRPLILCGRVGASDEAWRRRVELAERLGAQVITDLKTRAGFPTDHPLLAAAPGRSLRDESAAALRRADVVLALDWIDVGGTLRQAYGRDEVAGQVIACSADSLLHNGWSKDHFELAPVDVPIFAHPDLLVDALLDALPEGGSTAAAATPHTPAAAATGDDGQISLAALSRALHEALGDRAVSLLHLPTGWPVDDWYFRSALDFLGGDGGGGIGAGPGIAVGAALALRGSGRLPVAVLGDGDYLMGGTALWTAANLGLPMLVVVANNGTYLNDELHQERMAANRGRPVENAWIGQRIDQPRPDLGEFARSLGLSGFGPVDRVPDLAQALALAVAAAENGPSVLDVRIPIDHERAGGHERWRPETALAGTPGNGVRPGAR